MTIGEKIYTLRKEKNISQETMALDLNVSRQAVSKWETDQSLPDLDKIKILADYFNVSIDYLVNDCEFKNYNNDIKDEKIEDCNLNVLGKLKKLVKIFLFIVIGLNFLSIFYALTITLLQNVIFQPKYGGYVNQFVFPFNSILERIVIGGIVITFCFIFIKRINNQKTKFLNKVLFISIFEVFSFIYNVVSNQIYRIYIQSTSSNISKILMLNDYINIGNSLILLFSNTLLFLSIGMLMVISLVDKKK